MKKIFAFLAIISWLFFFNVPAFSQGIFDKVKEKAQQETEKAIDEALTEDEETQKEEPDKTEKTLPQEEDKKTDDPPKKSDFKTYSKYDFIPGERVIYFDDFSTDNIGDFPPNWYTNKSGEVITTNLFPGKWFQFAPDGQYFLDKLLKLPENFTMEFDVIPVQAEEDGGAIGFDITLLGTSEDDPWPGMGVPGEGGVIIRLYTPTAGHSISGYSDASYGASSGYDKEKGLLKKEEINHVSLWVQKTRVRVYLHGEKIFDLPKAYKSGMLLNQFRIIPDPYSAPMISNLRIAEAAPDMRSKLITEGKLVTTGILFDVNSDQIKPESYGVLKEIAKVLTENPDVRVKICGHTDSDGSDESNLDLSKRRSLSVKNILSSEFGINVSRMETDGKGESEPVDKNDTPGGKASNRRVEFTKL